jgi:hypothetical protein
MAEEDGGVARRGGGWRGEGDGWGYLAFALSTVSVDGSTRKLEIVQIIV